MAKQAAQRREMPMETVLTFSLELTVRGIEPNAEELTGTIPDALMAYDAENRLFPGKSRRDGMGALEGTSISLEKSDRRADRLAAIRMDKWVKPKFYDATETALPRDVDISCAVDDKIQELREAQARIWDARDAAINATDKGAFEAAVAKSLAAQGDCLKLLNCKLEDIEELK